MSYTHIFKCCCGHGKSGMHELRMMARAGQEYAHFYPVSLHGGEDIVLDPKEVKRMRDALSEWLDMWPAKMDGRSDDAERVDNRICLVCGKKALQAWDTKDAGRFKHTCVNCGSVFLREGLEVRALAGRAEEGHCVHCRGKGYVGDQFRLTCMECGGSGRRLEYEGGAP